MEEKNRSWCTSSNENDQRAVTIECASGKVEPYAMNEVVYDMLREKCFMHRKEKLVRFMTVLEIVNVCKTVENVEMCLVRYGLIPEIRSFRMKNLRKM